MLVNSDEILSDWQQRNGLIEANIWLVEDMHTVAPWISFDIADQATIPGRFYDHPTWWKIKNHNKLELVAITTQPYGPFNLADMKTLMDYCEAENLDVEISGGWYYPGSAIAFTFGPKGSKYLRLDYRR